MTAKRIAAEVDRIVDGDTLVVKIRVRIRGPHAPEAKTLAGQKSAARLASQFPPGTKVLLRPAAIDVFGRQVSDITRGTL